MYRGGKALTGFSRSVNKQTHRHMLHRSRVNHHMDTHANSAQAESMLERQLTDVTVTLHVTLAGTMLTINLLSHLNQYQLRRDQCCKSIKWYI